MAYISALAPCAVCKQVFVFNPMRVPSVRVLGYREPVCENCMAFVNQKRQANGLEPLPVLDGAYEPMDEREWVGDWSDE